MRLKTAIVWILGLSILTSMAFVFRDSLEVLAAQWERFSWDWVALVFLHTLIYRIINTFGWVWVLRALQFPMRFAQGVSIWLVSESCRWLPGSVWSMVSRVHLARQAGAGLALASASVTLELLLTILAWGITVMIGLIGTGAYQVVLPYLEDMVRVLWILAGLAGIALAVCGGLFFVYRRSGFLAQKLEKPLADLNVIRKMRPQPVRLLAIVVFYTLLCLYNGYIFHLILVHLDVNATLLQAILANSLGWLVGFFAIAVPGGIGVRESVIVALLAGVASLEVLAIAVICWRVLQIVAELTSLIPWAVAKIMPHR